MLLWLSFSHILKDRNVDIYNAIFKLHTKYTALLLLMFFCLVSKNAYFGDPINCLVDNDGDIEEFAENICWITGTFILSDVTTVVDGVARIQQVPVHQKYYQWIIVVLQLQSIIFYAPAFFWKSWENGRLNELCSSLGSACNPDEYQQKKKQLVKYLKSDNTRAHSAYFMRFVICEVMNFLILVLNMWMLDAMFNPFWVRYFPAVLALIQLDSEKFTLLANEIFPKLVKCSFMFIGPTGSDQLRDAQCQLSMNVVNAKIFATLYVWFLVLLFLSACYMIFRCISLASSNLRLAMIRSLVISPMPNIQMDMEIILRDRKICDWFMLYQIGRNLNHSVFKEVLEELTNSKRIQNNNYDDGPNVSPNLSEDIIDKLQTLSD